MRTSLRGSVAFIDGVADAHDLAVTRLDIVVEPLLDVAIADLDELAHGFAVGAAVRWALERADGRDNGAVQVGVGSGRGW